MNWRVKSLDDILATAERRSLTRSLGGVQLMLLGVGAIIGTGIFVLTAEAAPEAIARAARSLCAPSVRQSVCVANTTRVGSDQFAAGVQ